MANEQPTAQNPEIGAGDLLKYLQALAEAVLAGQTEVPVIHIKIVGKHVDLGPTPIKVS